MCAWTADHAHASRTRSKQSTGFRGRMHKSLTQTRPWEQNFAKAFLSIAIATARLTSRHILISEHFWSRDVSLRHSIFIHTRTHTHDWHTSRIGCGHTTIPILGWWCCKTMFTNMLFCCVHFGTISYSHTKFQFHNLLH